MPYPRIEYFRDEAGEWRWHVKAANNEVICQGEGHRTRNDAVRAAGAAFEVFKRAVEHGAT